MRRATTEILYFETGPDNAPTMRVAQGETFEVQTQLNRGPWLNTHPDGERLRKRLVGANPSSGAIHVDGANVGAALKVHVGEIRVDPLGFTRYSGFTPGISGWLGAPGVGPAERAVDIRDGRIQWGGGRTLPLRPMIGFMATAPARERFHNGWGGVWGGNFDVQEITTGATVFLPVEVEGALLHVGDMHAIQGDGEICGAGGIEASGVVRLACDVLPRPQSMITPRIVNKTHIATVAMSRPAEDAFRQALAAMILWLEDDYGFSKDEAYLWLGQVLEARCTQFVNPTFTYIAKVNKAYLPPSKSGLA